MSKPLYQTIYEDLKHQIETGTVAINDTLPTEKELSTTYSVSTITVKKALDLLKEDGYIVRKPRKGSVVVTNKKADIVPIQTNCCTLSMMMNRISLTTNYYRKTSHWTLINTVISEKTNNS